MKVCLRYWRSNTSHVLTKFSSPKIRSKSWNKGCVLASISQPNLHQIQLSGGVLESSGRADFKTVIDFQNWPRFVGEKDQNVSRQVKVDRLYTLTLAMVVLNGLMFIYHPVCHHHTSSSRKQIKIFFDCHVLTV